MPPENLGKTSRGFPEVAVGAYRNRLRDRRNRGGEASSRPASPARLWPQKSANAMPFAAPSPRPHLRGQGIDGRGHRAHAALRLGEAALLEALANLRHRLHAVAGVETGRVDLMLEPIAPRQPFGVPELPLRGEQQLVESCSSFVAEQRLRCSPFRPTRSLLETPGPPSRNASTAARTGSCRLSNPSCPRRASRARRRSASACRRCR